VCLYVIIILLHDLTLLRCKTCAIDIGSLKATYLLTYLLTYTWMFKLCRFSLSLMNVVGVSKLRWTDLILVDPVIKLNGTYCV